MRKFIALKYCQECGLRRRFFARLLANDDALCDDCYYKFIITVRERHE